MKKKVVLGMSGGVDSSVAAYVLQSQGYEVIGITMQVWPRDEEYEEIEGGCCSLSSVNDARRVADKLDIPFYVMNYREVFEKKVINYFVEEYLAGRTPNPCIACNKYIKFDEFLNKAKMLGADYIATGHYALIEQDVESGRYLMKRAVDDHKDQTYVLYGLTQHQFKNTLMPLYGYTKDHVRALAAEIGLSVANKPDSEEICFVPDNDYAKFIKKRVPDKVFEGNFIDANGKVLGKHKGIVNYTIGQRKGLGIAFGRPMFVADIIPDKNLVVLGEEASVFKDTLYADNLNLIPFDKMEGPMKVTAKIRSTAREGEALITPKDNGVIVKFDKPQRAITKGQAIVFYDGQIVIGGGTIKEIW